MPHASDLDSSMPFCLQKWKGQLRGHFLKPQGSLGEVYIVIPKNRKTWPSWGACFASRVLIHVGKHFELTDLSSLLLVTRNFYGVPDLGDLYLKNNEKSQTADHPFLCHIYPAQEWTTALFFTCCHVSPWKQLAVCSSVGWGMRKQGVLPLASCACCPHFGWMQTCSGSLWASWLSKRQAHRGWREKERFGLETNIQRLCWIMEVWDRKQIHSTFIGALVSSPQHVVSI